MTSQKPHLQILSTSTDAYEFVGSRDKSDNPETPKQEKLTPETVLFQHCWESSPDSSHLAASTPGPLPQGVTVLLPCLPGGGGLGMGTACVSLLTPSTGRGSPEWPQARQEFSQPV